MADLQKYTYNAITYFNVTVSLALPEPFLHAHWKQLKRSGPLTVYEWCSSFSISGWVLIGDNLLKGSRLLCCYKKCVIPCIDNDWIRSILYILCVQEEKQEIVNSRNKQQISCQNLFIWFHSSVLSHDPAGRPASILSSLIDDSAGPEYMALIPHSPYRGNVSRTINFAVFVGSTATSKIIYSNFNSIQIQW